MREEAASSPPGDRESGSFRKSLSLRDIVENLFAKIQATRDAEDGDTELSLSKAQTLGVSRQKPQSVVPHDRHNALCGQKSLLRLHARRLTAVSKRLGLLDEKATSGSRASGPNLPSAILDPAANEEKRWLLRLHLAIDPLLWPARQLIDPRLLNWRTLDQLAQLIATLPILAPCGLAYAICTSCGDKRFCPWIKIFCGGCERDLWVRQSVLTGLWCVECDREWRRKTVLAALQEETGLPGIQGLSLYESWEQREIARLKWEVQWQVSRIKSQTKTSILQEICGKHVDLPGHWMVQPRQMEELCHRLSILPPPSRDNEPRRRRNRRRRARNSPYGPNST
ncbi:uncharacterized protein LOC118698803 [Molothrus ater]|uniref:uncharacterized protein LOC118698803 n=1 Tax=Molothrus ater TaxID=84834 RepID=UPI00174AFD86|nr:uncharacterized protein LOC118698803 [Molothrus ater]